MNDYPKEYVNPINEVLTSNTKEIAAQKIESYFKWIGFGVEFLKVLESEACIQELRKEGNSSVLNYVSKYCREKWQKIERKNKRPRNTKRLLSIVGTLMTAIGLFIGVMAYCQDKAQYEKDRDNSPPSIFNQKKDLDAKRNRHKYDTTKLH